MTAVLTIGLQTVRAEFNSVFPKRDKASDGWIGDRAHQGNKSGHNPDRTGNAEYRDGDSLDEVRAIDVDADLRDASGRKVTMETVIQYLIKRARAGVYVPFRYIIYKGRIWSRTDGWKTRTYTGSNKHNGHAHFSGDYSQKADGWKGSLGLKSLVTVVIVKPAPAGGLPVHKNGSRVNREGQRGTDIQTLQRFIGKDWMGAADGIAGPKFTAGIKRYQRMRGIKVDGLAGPQTWGPILKAIR
ncbi:MAG TPA: peptidoglycan-binding domain-containing protein [Armatimonadota bacterium]|nr:peptidoglycan-binding domain-containing protein [Armatimonadota bacterium]